MTGIQAIDIASASAEIASLSFSWTEGFQRFVRESDGTRSLEELRLAYEYKAGVDARCRDFGALFEEQLDRRLGKKQQGRSNGKRGARLRLRPFLPELETPHVEIYDWDEDWNEDFRALDNGSDLFDDYDDPWFDADRF